MRRGHSGLSLIEVIIAFSVLAIAALGVIAAMTRLMMAQSSSSHQTVARIMADSLMQETALSGPSDWPPLETWGPVVKRSVRVGQNSELVDYSYQLRAERMIPVAGMGKLPPTTSADMGTVYQIRVRVWWNLGEAAESAVEKGTRTLEVTRMTYIEQ